MKKPTLWSVAVLLLSAAVIAACTTTAVPQTGGSNRAEMQISDSQMTGPAQVSPGVATIVFDNTSQSPRTVIVGRLNTDVTIDQFLTALQSDPLQALSMAGLIGGREAPAGGQSEFGANLQTGTYVVVAFPDGEAAPLIANFDVSGTASTETAPSPDVEVNLFDFAFALPLEIEAGENTWQVTNNGQQWHEMVLFKLEEGQTQEDLLEMFQSQEESEGPPDFGQSVFFGPQTQGESAWFPLDLEPGTYSAVCFLPDLTGQGEPHVMKGMIQTFEVR